LNSSGFFTLRPGDPKYAYNEPLAYTYPCSASVAVVEVDLETGEVPLTLLRVLVPERFPARSLLEAGSRCFHINLGQLGRMSARYFDTFLCCSLQITEDRLTSVLKRFLTCIAEGGKKIEMRDVCYPYLVLWVPFQ
jgi:hypothetical protein